MKNIKSIINVNWWLIALTIPLYFVMVGIIFHVILGIFQVSVFVFELLQNKKYTPFLKVQMWLYSILALFTVAIMISASSEFLYYAWISSCILPFYFTGILYQLKNQIIKL